MQSYRQQFRWTFSIAVFCLWIPVRVFMLDTLRGCTTLGQTELKVVLNGSEEVLEAVGGSV